MIKSPSQQALIQFIESILITALIAGLVSISSTVLGTGPIDLKETAISFGLAVAFSLAHSLATYLKALPAPQQDGATGIAVSELGTVLDAFLAQLQQRVTPATPTTFSAPVAATQQTPTPLATTTPAVQAAPISFDTQAMAALSVPSPVPSATPASVPLQAPFVQ